MKTDVFANRHIGITENDLPKMLERIGVKTLDELIDKTIPEKIPAKSSVESASCHDRTEVCRTYRETGFYEQDI